MPDFAIVPAHDERVMCNFTVPRKGQSDLRFSIPRMEFIDPAIAEEHQRWADGWKVKIREAIAAGKTEDDDELGVPTNREIRLKELGMVLSKTKLAAIEKLSTGEIDQIYDAWQNASLVTVGESPASETSSSEADSPTPSASTSSPTGSTPTA